FIPSGRFCATGMNETARDFRGLTEQSGH
ncbi:MAG: hypothetical protein RJA57_907, partial [Bacteroidota bacterium]